MKNKYNLRVIAVDPGANCCGLAILDPAAKGPKMYVHSMFLRKRGGQGSDWISRVDAMVERVSAEFHSVEHCILIIELPSNMGNAASAGQNILKLMAFVFALRQKFLERKILRVELIPVNLWKGNAPKEITFRRVRKRFPQWKGTNLDESDAIGLGLWYLTKRYEENQTT